MALGVLGALRHADALPAMAALARDQEAARDCRWEALRPTLAMDTRSGLELLAALAENRNGPPQPETAGLQTRLAAACPDLAPAFLRICVMPLVIDNPPNIACTLPECIEALADLGFDADESASTGAAADWLRRLANNRAFMGDLLVERLTGRGGDDLASGYGPPAIMLSRPRANRANAAVLRDRDLALTRRPRVPDQRRRQLRLRRPA